MYAITAQVRTYEHGHDVHWRGSVQVPVFYLDADVQGITDEGHAVRLARQIIDPLGVLNTDIHAERIEP